MMIDHPPTEDLPFILLFAQPLPAELLGSFAAETRETSINRETTDDD